MMTPVSEALATYMCTVASLSPLTFRDYHFHLTLFEEYCSARDIHLEQITPKVYRGFLDHVALRINPRTKKPIVARTLAAYAQKVKTFLTWVSLYEDYSDCVKPSYLQAMRRPKVERRVMGIFTQEEVGHLYQACKLSNRIFLVDRDTALISLLIDCGLRANELCTLKIGDVHLSSSDSYVKVMGKGMKEREIGLGNKARLDLSYYLKTHRSGAAKDDLVFLAYKRVPLNRYSLDQIIYRLKSRAGVEKPGGAHMFRRTYATAFLDNGGNIYDLRDLMGHEHLSTTEEYARNTNRRNARKRNPSVWDQM